MILHPDVTHPRTLRRFETLESDLYDLFGDTLDFTDSIFSGMKVKIWYWCNNHNKLFESEPDTLLRSAGIGCPDCSNVSVGKMSNNKARSEFKAEAELKHPNKFMYHLVDYIDSISLITLFCIGCDCEFAITPNQVLNGGGHPTCSAKMAGLNQIIVNSLVFAAKAEKKHPNKYLYHLVDYKKAKEKVTLWCIECDCDFEITPEKLLSGHGHSVCGNNSRNENKKAKYGEMFPARAELKHPNKNYYHLVDYKGTDDKVELYCIECDVPYWITPGNCLSGRGHAECANWGFKYESPAVLYYLRIETRNQICYKIGITNLSVNERFKNYELENITIIKEWKYDLGSDAYAREQEILKEFKEFRYCGEDILESGGNTELFYKDVLELDKSTT